MEVPTVSIKIKGLDAIDALGQKGKLLGTIKAKGAASVKLGELEAKRVLVTKKGVVLQELEGHVVTELPGTKAAVVKGTVVKGAVGTKGAVVVKAASAKSVAAVPALSAKGIGCSLGLGGFGPWMALAALGMAATGVYFYLRARATEGIADESGELESPV